MRAAMRVLHMKLFTVFGVGVAWAFCLGVFGGTLTALLTLLCRWGVLFPDDSVCAWTDVGWVALAFAIAGLTFGLVFASGALQEERAKELRRKVAEDECQEALAEYCAAGFTAAQAKLLASRRRR